MPDVRRRHRDVLGETPVTIHADDLRERAHVRVAGSAEKAAAIDDVPLRGDTVSFLYIGDESSDLDDIAGEFMSDYKGRLATTFGPRIPVVDVDVGSANPGSTYAYESFVLTDPRLRDILQVETRCRGFLDERFH